MTVLVVVVAWLVLSLVVGAVLAAFGWYVRSARNLSERSLAELAAVTATEPPPAPTGSVA